VGVFEQKIIENCRYIMQHLQDFRLEHKMEGIESIGLILEEFDTIEPFTEWNDFIERHQYSLVLENSAYKTEDSVQYPNQHHEYVRASKIGHLATKQGGLSKSWVQGVCVITPCKYFYVFFFFFFFFIERVIDLFIAGFLHCYKTPQYFQARATEPTFSIYIADCHIIPGDTREHCFTIKNKLKNNRKSRLSSFNVSTSYTFLAANREESLEWQQALGAIRNEVVPLMTTTLVPQQPQYRNQAPMPDHVLPETSSQSVSDFNQPAPSMEFTRERAERPLPQDPVSDDEEIVPAARQVQVVPMDAAACLDAVQNPSISPYDILSMAQTGMGSYTIPTTDAYADPVLSDHEEEIQHASLQDDTSDEDDVYEASVHEEQVATPEEAVVAEQEDEEVLSVQGDILSVQEEEVLPEEEVLSEQEVLSDEELTNEIHQLINLPLEDDSEDMEYDPATIAQQEANKLGPILDIQEAPQSQNAMDNEKRVEQSV
jgi:hypothetical protein